MCGRTFLSISFTLFLITPIWARASFEISLNDQEIFAIQNNKSLSEPTSSLAQLKRAFTLYKNDKLESSKKILLSLIQDKQFALREYALFLLAKIHYDKNQIKSALRLFNLIEEAPHPDFFRMKGNIYFWLKNKNLSIKNYQEYLSYDYTTDPLLSKDQEEKIFYPKLRLALSLEDQDPQEALKIFMDLYTSFPNTDLRFILGKVNKLLKGATESRQLKREALFYRARAFQAQTKYKQASELYLLFLKKSEKDDPLVARALKELYYIKKNLNNYKAQKRLLKLLTQYDKGQVDTHTGSHIVSLAKFYWTQERGDQALKVLAKITTLHSQRDQDEALFTRAQIFAQRKNYEKSVFLLNTRTFKSKDLDEKRLYFMGWYQYLSNNHESATRSWKQLEKKHQNSSYYRGALYWQAQSLKMQKTRSISSIENLFSKILISDAHSYYAYLTRYESKSITQLKISNSLNFTFTKKSLDYYGINFHWLEKSKILIKGQLKKWASYAISKAFAGGTKKLSWQLLYLKSSLYSMSGEYLKSIIILNSTLSKYKKIPNYYLKILYPRAYFDLAQKYGKTYNISPYLILSMMRQESAFNKHAKSGAHALGLMQVLPRTGRILAQVSHNGGFQNRGCVQ